MEKQNIIGHGIIGIGGFHMMDSLKGGDVPQHIFKDTDIIDFHGTKMTYREFRNKVDKDDSLVRLASGEIITKKEWRNRAGVA